MHPAFFFLGYTVRMKRGFGVLGVLIAIALVVGIIYVSRYYLERVIPPPGGESVIDNIDRAEEARDIMNVHYQNLGN